jgi:signal transduction histidine kinase
MDSPNQTFGTSLRKLDGKGGYVITYWEYQANCLATGEVDGVIGIGYDITAFESRKEHIRFLNETLKNVAHTQSHDIRRPLANVIGLVDLLKLLGQDNEVIGDLADKLSQSCQELNEEFEHFFVKTLPESEDSDLT